MAMKRFPLEQFATVELNQVAFPKTGMVVSQTPLGEKFVEGEGNYGVCEMVCGFLPISPRAILTLPLLKLI